MLDINYLRKNYEEAKNKLIRRNKKWESFVIEILTKDKKYLELLNEIEKINAQKNIANKEINNFFAQHKTNEANEIIKKMSKLKSKVVENEQLSKKLKDEIDVLLLSLPNLPDDSVPNGQNENDNKIIKKWGQPTTFNFEPKPHWILGKINKLVDFEHASKLAGSRFTCYTNYGAKLFRALIQYTLDKNVEAGFVEYLPPVIVNHNVLIGTGQLPKFEQDLFKLTNGFFLSPTAECQLTNFHANEILDLKQLPIQLTANTCCFRSEAGSAGKDTKGVIRQHQFYKTEMVILANPNESWAKHEFMTNQAEKILQELKLPYRRIVLCTGDMGFSAAKTYDIEVWLPSYNNYKEISSCSNCVDFQARRMKLRFKDIDGKNRYVHTLNGSGLAIDRLWAAVIENYQQIDGSIIIPNVLQPYLNGIKIIK